MLATDPGADNEASHGAGRRGRHRVLATGTHLHFTEKSAQARQGHSAPATRSTACTYLGYAAAIVREDYRLLDFVLCIVMSTFCVLPVAVLEKSLTM